MGVPKSMPRPNHATRQKVEQARARGLTDWQIADRLGLPVEHVAHILAAQDQANREQDHR